MHVPDVLGGRWAFLGFDALMLVMAFDLAVVAGHSGTPGAIWLYPLVVLAVLGVRGAYSPRLRRSMMEAVPAVAAALSVPAMVALTVASGVGAGGQLLGTMCRLWLFSLVLVSAGRALLTLAQRVRVKRRAGEPVLIVGGGVVGLRIARRLVDRPEFGLRPVGILDVEPMMGETVLPLIDTPDHMVEAAQRTDARHVILAFSSVPDHELLPHVRRCEEAGLAVSLVPRLFESSRDRVRVDSIGGLPLLSMHVVDPKGWQFQVKYLLDRVLAVFLLVLFSPLLALCAAAVRLSSPGPVLFRQRRVGLDGAEFDLLKFRSMRVTPVLPGFIPADGLAPGGVEGHDRRTSIGRWLRRSCLDELPQLVNVLRGEMSLVGPRPERPEFVELFGSRIDGYPDRHRVKSGITGWAQVNGLRGQTSLADRVELDNHYIRNWSLALDAKILLLTIVAVLARERVPMPVPDVISCSRPATAAPARAVSAPQ